MTADHYSAEASIHCGFDVLPPIHLIDKTQHAVLPELWKDCRLDGVAAKMPVRALGYLFDLVVVNLGERCSDLPFDDMPSNAKRPTAQSAELFTDRARALPGKLLKTSKHRAHRIELDAV
jgi:hypothetical protein